MEQAFDYIASGPSHTRFSLSEFRNDDKSKEIVNRMIRSMEGKNSHHFSLLYNGFLESKFGELFDEVGFTDSVYSVHSDSGGLQIVTQGKVATPQIKQQIYEAQGRHSDYAMSFDEIPVVLTGATSNRNDVSGRFFDRENLEKYARMSGRNLKEQIQYFVEHDLRAKPLLIVQGNNKESFDLWCKYVLDEIPLELQAKIGGYASGAAALGNGQLEDIERSFYSAQLELPDHIKSYMHILGVGSLKRMLPTVTFKRNGVTGNTRISYDSSTHTSGLTMGHYYARVKGMTSLSRLKDAAFYSAVADIQKNWGDFIDFDVEQMLQLTVLGKSEEWNAFALANPDKIYQRYVTLFALLLTSVSNFTADIEHIYNTGDYQSFFKRSKDALGYAYLEKIKTTEDFEHWKSHVGKHLKSNRVRDISMKTKSIEDFFE